MKTIRLKSRTETGESVIVCRKNIFSHELAPMREEWLEGGLVFTDENVLRLYGNQLKHYLGGVPVHAMPAGEKNKTEQTLFSLLRTMGEVGLRRNSTLIALGGGVVGDVGGLAASLYMRGIRCIQVPTTLLAQVDSSVGGKTAIDFCGVKNLVGAFHQPARVLADPIFLSTLPPREIRCGLGEIVKHGALCGELFDTLWENRTRLTEISFLADIIPQNIAFKAEIVRKDPREAGLRKCLNLGHTTAHAIELLGGELSHGECVLLGTALEARIARKHFSCDEAYLARLETLCLLALGTFPQIDAKQAARLALLDKKNGKKGEVVLCVPTARGEYAFLSLGEEDYAEALQHAWEEIK